MIRNVLFALSLLALAAVPAAAQKKQKVPPEPGTVFHVSDAKPGWPTAAVEFRDPADERWPNFFYGRPAGPGALTFDPNKPAVKLALRCDQQAQKRGDQSRRVLGELLGEGRSVAVTLALESMGALTTEKVETTDRRGKKTTKTVEYAPVKGALEIDGRKAAVEGKATFRWGYAKNGERPESVYVDVTFRVKPAELGLKAVTSPLDCRAGFTAYATLPEGKKK